MDDRTIKPFCGLTGEDPQAWMDQYLGATAARGWSDSKRLDNFGSFLRDEADNWWRTEGGKMVEANTEEKLQWSGNSCSKVAGKFVTPNGASGFSAKTLFLLKFTTKPVYQQWWLRLQELTIEDCRNEVEVYFGCVRYVCQALFLGCLAGCFEVQDSDKG
eukprot:TRINITY_DN1366_c0_g1_i3.p1 TRINITY_DN1366_c0_g1~~TRINITY_DN1366_c0_g1_i3.p1  ORF type:complete len:160 (+),score=28.01 TRINITY_DN1366_c0_g1_i3:325-804(+)